jgi:flavin reductase (DIM6/NTAB) family NADH-FMN oxidoreductase RutF
VSEVSLRDVMRTFPQGVVVVTAEGDDGARGITVSSFLSVSLTPPLVLVSVMREARAHAAIDRGRFVVNVLSDAQGHVSDHFATPNLTSDQQFEKVTARDSPPRIEGCLGYLECKVVQRIPVADHTLFIGEVERAELGVEGKPVVFYGRQYWGLEVVVHDRG